MLNIRNELPDDVAAITAVTVAAFQQAEHSDHTEQFIVRDLRNAGALSVSLVAQDQSCVIGHVAVSPVRISTGAQGWYGLGPLSVAPQYQGLGVGSALMRAALEALRMKGACGCVVLGEPSYYARFGFVVATDLVLPDVPAGYFQQRSFDGSLPAGQVFYHAAFASKN